MAVICPYCLSTLGDKDLVRRCHICGEAFKGSFLDNMKLKKGIIPRCSSTAGCLGQYSTLSCAKCDTELPPDIAQYDKYVRFSVVAPPAAGKTVFLTAMIDELKQARNLNFHVAYMNKETQNYYMNNYRQIYENLAPVGATTLGASYPMQWKLQDMRKATKTRVPSYSITMFDGAGEDQVNMDPVVCRCISGSKMIMLLLDPTRLAGVREQMTPEEIDLASGPKQAVSRDDTQDFIIGMINYLKTACSIPVTKKLPIPVAVVFGKIDVVKRHLGQAMVLQPSGHVQQGKFIQSEADQIHNEIDGWMDGCGDLLTRMFDANFVTWRYFGMSSFGNMPPSRNQFAKPMPLRVLDPLLWDLSLEGIIPKG